jgi:hypothetical protein
MRNILRAIPGVAALFISATSVRATVIASDSFNTRATGAYNAGVSGLPLSGQTATNGTFGYFTGASGGNPAPGWNLGTFGDRVDQGQLSHSLFVNPAPLANGGEIFAAGDGVAHLQYRDFTSTTPPASPTYFFSALVYQEAFNAYQGTSYIGLGPSRASAASSTAPTTGFDVGYLNGAITLFYNNGGATLASETLLASPQILGYLVEVAVTGSGAATTLTPKVYHFQGALLNDPAAQAVTATLAPTDMGAFQVFQSADFNNGAPAHINFDELRFGTAESEVVAPEPASLALLGIGLGLVTRRSGRRACGI